MTKELTLDLVQSQLKPNQRQTIGEETVAEIQKLAEDPDYGEEFLDCYIDHLNIFKENAGRSHTQYLNAVKFFSLVESGNSLTDSYIKLFPERYQARKRNNPTEENSKELVRGEASRFNSSMLVTEIRKVAAVPVQLIHRHLLHKAILKQADLMENACSEIVQQKASACLIEQLKPEEDNTIKVKVEDNTTSVIEQLSKAAEALAIRQNERVLGGLSVQAISSSKIQEAVVVEGEVVDE